MEAEQARQAKPADANIRNMPSKPKAPVHYPGMPKAGNG